MPLSPTQYADAIYGAAHPVIRINGLMNSRWKRRVAPGDARGGPWLAADYVILDPIVWKTRTPCLYMVSGLRDGGLRYVGISRNRMADRWRESPAFHEHTMEKLGSNQLFHSQCWKHIEQEHAKYPLHSYEVRCLTSQQIVPVVTQHGAPLSAVLMHGDDGESIVNGIERWMCNKGLVQWNVAMPGRLKKLERAHAIARPACRRGPPIYLVSAYLPTSFWESLRQVRRETLPVAFGSVTSR